MQQPYQVPMLDLEFLTWKWVRDATTLLGVDAQP